MAIADPVAGEMLRAFRRPGLDITASGEGFRAFTGQDHHPCGGAFNPAAGGEERIDHSRIQRIQLLFPPDGQPGDGAINPEINSRIAHNASPMG